LAAQKKSAEGLLGKVILYGSIYDPHVHYPREPLYRSTISNSDGSSTNVTKNTTNTIMNQFDDAISDFTLEGTIPPEPARLFAEAALLSDPVKAVWKNLYQFNNCDPARVHVPCLVIAGDQDPYSSLHMQQELFLHLGRASDRTWSILTGCDHAVHLLDDGRDRLINTVTSFVLNSGTR
jgi:pimeloyl-ACP methyl ester carboxylesterase